MRRNALVLTSSSYSYSLASHSTGFRKVSVLFICPFITDIGRLEVFVSPTQFYVSSTILHLACIMFDLVTTQAIWSNAIEAV